MRIGILGIGSSGSGVGRQDLGPALARAGRQVVVRSRVVARAVR